MLYLLLEFQDIWLQVSTIIIYDVEDYIKKLFECKIYINTLSPINLVSPRYLETFASNSNIIEKSVFMINF